MESVIQELSRQGFRFVFAAAILLNALSVNLILTRGADAADEVNSRYTSQVSVLISKAIPNDEEIMKAEPLWLKAWTTPEHNLYIGAEQAMMIEAPLARVRQVLDDIDHYVEIFPGYKEIRVTERDEKRWLTYWEQIVPLFFIPNVKYEMIYRFEDPSPSRRIYRYQLRKASTLTASDGVIVIEAAAGGKRTRFRELDFFDANWGPAAFRGADQLWIDALEGIALSDLGIRLRAENPAWDSPRVLSEAQRLIKAHPIDKVAKTRSPLAERK